MDKQFNKGLVIKLEENSNDKFIIIENLKIENNIYLLLTNFEGKLESESIKDVNIDYSKIFMVCIDENTNEVSYNHNKEIIELLVEKSLKG